MKAPNKTLILVVCSAAVAIAAMYLFSWLKSDGEPTTNEYTFLWEKVIVITIAVFSLVFGFVEPRAPWRWPLVMAYVHYLSGFFIMKHWGQIPPFELNLHFFTYVTGYSHGLLRFFPGKKT